MKAGMFRRKGSAEWDAPWQDWAWEGRSALGMSQMLIRDCKRVPAVRYYYRLHKMWHFVGRNTEVFIWKTFTTPIHQLQQSCYVEVLWQEIAPGFVSAGLHWLWHIVGCLAPGLDFTTPICYTVGEAVWQCAARRSVSCLIRKHTSTLAKTTEVPCQLAYNKAHGWLQHVQK